MNSKTFLPALKKQAPLLLAVLSSLGVIATAAAAVKATPKAVEKIKNDSRKTHDGDPHAFTKKEAVISAWKCYIPTAAIGASTIICIFGINAFSKKQQAALISAYGLVKKSYQDYQGKVKELFGEEAHEQILKSLACEKAKDIPLYAQTLGGSECLDFMEFEDQEKHLFYDSFSERYFQSTFERVLQAEYHLNRNFVLGFAESLNEFYLFLGIEEIEGGDDIGWVMSDGISWIDFNHSKATIDEGLDCYVIDMSFVPSPFDDI